MKIKIEIGEMKAEIDGDAKDLDSAIKVLIKNKEEISKISSTTMITKEKKKSKSFADSLTSRLEMLIEDGFFNEPHGLAEIKQKLQEVGYHYPRTTISPAILQIVRQRRLRRIGSMRKFQYVKP